MMLGSAESERPTQTNGEIIFEKVQSINDTDRLTDGQMTVLCTVVHRVVKSTDILQ